MGESPQDRLENAINRQQELLQELAEACCFEETRLISQALRSNVAELEACKVAWLEAKQDEYGVLWA